MKKLSLAVLGLAVFGITAAATFSNVATTTTNSQGDCWDNEELTGDPYIVQGVQCPGTNGTCCYKPIDPENPELGSESFDENPD